MVRTILNGSNGRMGRAIATAIAGRTDFSVVAGVDLTDSGDTDFPVYPALSAVNETADAVIDFSSPNETGTMIAAAAERKLPVVVATTGLTEDHIKQLKKYSATIPILQAANMSVGINLLRMLVRQAVQVLGDGFDIEIIEKHHNLKKDAPSGTALALAHDAAGETDDRFVYGREGRDALRTAGEIGIHAVRGGTISGEHDVIFAGTDEVITLRHSAYSRTLFATGALKAAAFLVGQPPGFYSMEDVLSTVR